MAIGIWQVLLILGIVLLVFGTGKLRNIGSDLGNSLKDFKKAINEDEAKKVDAPADPLVSEKVVGERDQTKV